MYSDGSIVIDTTIDTDGFAQDADSLKKMLDSLSGQLDKMQQSLTKAFAGDSSAMTGFTDMANEAKAQIEQLEKDLATLGQQRIQSPEMAELTQDFAKAEAALVKLYNRQEKMSETGVKENSAAWRGLAFDIQKA